MAKPKLRDLSREELSGDDFQTVLAQLDAPDVPDMVAAILAASFVEYHLEHVIKRNFRRSDATAWGRMIDGAGPLRDFHTKIVIGYAFGHYDEDLRVNLNIIREIRNAFAHSRTLLQFTNPIVKAELKKIRPVRSGRRLIFSGVLAVDAEKRAYLNVCLSVYTAFQKKLETSLGRGENKLKKMREDAKLLRQLLDALEEDKIKRREAPQK